MFIDQAGNVLSETPEFKELVGWVRPLPWMTHKTNLQPGQCGLAGVPRLWDTPLYDDTDTVGEIADPYAWGFALVALWAGIFW